MLAPAHSLSANRLPWSEVAFVADLVDGSANALEISRRDDLEQTDNQLLRDVLGAISALGLKGRHFESPAKLAAAAPELRDAVVFSTYAGRGSRSRLALVPAVAEACGLDFVGLDAMGQALAHDKEVMKRIAMDCGLSTPPWRVIRSDTDAKICLDFPAPYVVKPMCEGSSIGITQANIIKEGQDGASLALDLLDRFRQPVLVEGFVPGREASFVTIQGLPADYQCFVEVAVDGDPGYFDTRLFDADEKFHRRLPRRIKRIDADLRVEDREAIERLLFAVGHYGYARVDGRLDRDGRFHFLELTPDAWLGILGHVAQGFMAEGWTYAEVIHAILASVLSGRRGQAANG